MIERLTREHEPALEELLGADPIVNLFLLGFLAVHPVDRTWWYGVIDGERIRGAVMVLPGRLCVPWAPEPGDATALGRHLAGLHRPCMTVGPRADVDRIWELWGAGASVRRRYDQRLYVLAEPPPGEPEPGLRRGRIEEWPTIARYSGWMEEEDLGRNPYEDDAQLHEQVVQDRVRSGRTWVLDHEGEIVFQVNVGTTTAIGCQIGGTYVPVTHRGRGWAKRGIGALCRRLLTEPAATSRPPLVTLHVNEANTPAIRTYEAVGFQRSAPFRLVTL